MPDSLKPNFPPFSCPFLKEGQCSYGRCYYQKQDYRQAKQQCCKDCKRLTHCDVVCHRYVDNFLIQRLKAAELDAQLAYSVEDLMKELELSHTLKDDLAFLLRKHCPTKIVKSVEYFKVSEYGE